MTQVAREFSRLADEADCVGTQHTTAAAQNASDAVKDTCAPVSSKVDEDQFLTKKYQHDVDDIRDAAHRSSDAAEDDCQTATAKAKADFVSSKEYVRQNPFPVALGALIAGVTIGCMIGMAHREEPTFRQRYFR